MSKQNFKQATKRSKYLANVDKLNQFGTSTNEFVDTESVVEGILGDFVLRVQENINKEAGMVTTGSISEIEVKAENGQVNVYANPWLVYQDRGVNGAKKKLYNTPHAYTDKRPPVGVFKQWIKDKNIRLVNNEKYKGEASPFKELTEDEQITKAAWGMATKVYNEGFKPRKIYSKEIPQLVDDLANELGDFMIQALNQVIDVKESAKRNIISK
jgi:hypothetical protein